MNMIKITDHDLPGGSVTSSYTYIQRVRILGCSKWYCIDPVGSTFPLYNWTSDNYCLLERKRELEREREKERGREREKRIENERNI